jgi:Ser/Thr protein kinase RdoA (MazF antagonist)
MSNSFDGDQPTEDLLDLNEVMQAFGVTSWQNLGSLPTTSPAGVLLSIEGQDYVLKEQSMGLLDEDIQHRYDFQQYLRQAGIPIPPIRLTTQGEPVVAVGEDIFELQRLPEGEQFRTADPRSIEWVGYAGSMLAHLHRASEDYRGTRHLWPSEAHIGAMVQGYLNLARTRAEESSVEALSVSLNNWVDQLEAVLPRAMISIGAGRNLPQFHIHGDYQAHNLRFDDSRVTAVIGFEATHWEKRIFEVAYALFSFSALSWQSDSSVMQPLVKRGFEPERMHRFLRSYGEVYPPVAGEANLLTDALLLVSPLATLNGPLEDLFYAQGELDSALIEEVLERLAWAASLPQWLPRIRGSLQEMWEQ